MAHLDQRFRERKRAMAPRRIPIGPSRPRIGPISIARGLAHSQMPMKPARLDKNAIRAREVFDFMSGIQMLNCLAASVSTRRFGRNPFYLQ
jgi:hypothetical protein